MRKYISSTQNSLFKKCIQLRDKARIRNKTNQFLIEGLREVFLALHGDYQLTTILFNPNILSEKDLVKIRDLSQNNALEVELSDSIYDKLALRGSTEGIIAIASGKNHDLGALTLKNSNPLILVAESPEKPGNIGALLRTADAAGIDAVIIANPRTDLYNPHIIRTSIGCVFTTPIATGSTTEIIDYLKTMKISTFGAALSASKAYDQINYTGATAIVVGTEASGLSDDWLGATNENIIIPMQGEIDSLNVSVSAAVIIFEAVRQRKIQS